MQIKPQAFLTLDDMANSIHDGYEHFSELPYLERLFTLIAKQTPDKVFFEDYLTGVSSFCLLNSESVLRFVFDWLDTDGDERITKENILTAADYAHPKNKKSTFFVNFVPELDQELKDGQKLMTFNEFNTLCNKIPFLIWPAYSLQEKLRAHKRLRPNCAPEEAAVVTVPGPIKAAEMTDQKRMRLSFIFATMIFSEV